MIIKRNVILGLIFLSMFSAIPLRAEEIQSTGTVPDLRTQHSEVVESGLSPGSMEEGGMEHEDMDKDKEHEGMHGMMMGHHMKGWWIVIGVVMVIMMGAHVAVLF